MVETTAWEGKVSDAPSIKKGDASRRDGKEMNSRPRQWSSSWLDPDATP